MDAGVRPRGLGIWARCGINSETHVSEAVRRKGNGREPICRFTETGMINVFIMTGSIYDAMRRIHGKTVPKRNWLYVIESKHGGNRTKRPNLEIIEKLSIMLRNLGSLAS